MPRSLQARPGSDCDIADAYPQVDPQAMQPWRIAMCFSVGITAKKQRLQRLSVLFDPPGAAWRREAIAPARGDQQSDHAPVAENYWSSIREPRHTQVIC